MPPNRLGATGTAVYNDFTQDLADNWSNLPCGANCRNGLLFSDLSDDQLAAALAVAQTAFSEEGYATFQGIRAADDYLAEQGGGGGGPGGGGYGSGIYLIAFLGTPSTTDEWMLQLGGHHYAVNFYYEGDATSPTPNFIGVEPLTFTLDGETYAPMAGREEAMTTMLDALSSEELDAAELSGTFDDVLLGPGEDGQFPDTPSGLQVSTLTTEQQALVTAAIGAWIDTLPDEEAEAFLAEYTSAEAFTDTYIGWSTSADLDVQHSYIRIDGPRVWIEIVAQNGVVL